MSDRGGRRKYGMYICWDTGGGTQTWKIRDVCGRERNVRQGAREEVDVIWGRPSRSNAQPVLDGVEVQVEVTEVPSRIDSGSQPPYMPFVSLGNSATDQGLLSLGNFKSCTHEGTRSLCNI